MPRHYFFGALLVALPLGVGCGDSGIGQVHGTVKLDGVPLPEALVEFYPADSSAASAGRTDREGKYQLHLGRQGLGAVVGTHKVQIWTSLGKDTGDGPAAQEIIPTKYNAESELKRDVTSGSNIFDFDLESKGKVIQQPGTSKKGR